MSSEKKPKIVGVIPARLNSERLPGKVLRSLAGCAMLHHVYDGARACLLLDELLVATDAEAVRDYCAAHQIPVLMTSSAHRSGTERIDEVAQRIPADVFVNLQADEPFVAPDHVRLLVEPFLSGQATHVSTLKVALDGAAAMNPHVVKVVTDLRGQALYFSRAPIPTTATRLVRCPTTSTSACMATGGRLWPGIGSSRHRHSKKPKNSSKCGSWKTASPFTSPKLLKTPSELTPRKTGAPRAGCSNPAPVVLGNSVGAVFCMRWGNPPRSRREPYADA